MTPAKGYAKMKDSGIEWVGMIPATWDVFPAGGVFDEVKEKNVNNQYSNPFSFRYGEIVDKKIAGEIDESLEETLSAYRVVSPNTIMINGLNLNYDFISQRVRLLEKKESLHLPTWLYNQMKGVLFQDLCYISSKHTTIDKYFTELVAESEKL